MPTKPVYDLCVIGGGSAGLVAAAGGAALGARVVLIEKHALGGECLYTGCVPSKALLHAAKTARTLRQGQTLGGHNGISSQPGIEWAMQWARQAIQAIALHDSSERFRAMGVEVIFGEGHFVDAGTFVVDGRRITARRFVLATGSRPMVPDIDGLDGVPYLTNENVFDLREPVPHLAIIGGGPIALELAQAFVRLGSDVSVVVRGERALRKEDLDLARVVCDQLEREGVHFYFNAIARRLSGEANDLLLILQTLEGEQTLRASHLLIATGRQGNVDGLNLAAAGVEVEDSYVRTDNRLRTTQKHIYACGDITNRYQFTHSAEYQAGIVLRNALFHWPAKVGTQAVPWATFTDPELARVGLSEEEARQQGVAHRIYRFPFQDIDRAQTDDETEGCTQVVAAPNGRILGAAIVGANAGELIHEYALAIHKRLKLSDISSLIHIYPTLAQVNRRVADQRLQAQLTPFAKKWIRRIFGLRGAT